MSLRAYTARRMTGEKWADLALQAARDRATLAAHKIEALDPVLAEIQAFGSVPTGTVGTGTDTVEGLKEHWARDKRMIRQSHVLIDLSPEHKSEGIAHEIGLARYAYWMPIIRVYRDGPVPVYSIACFEDDLICDSLEQAAWLIRRYWGTWRARFVWRAAMYVRSAPKHYMYKLKRWFL